MKDLPNRETYLCGLIPGVRLMGSDDIISPSMWRVSFYCKRAHMVDILNWLGSNIDPDHWVYGGANRKFREESSGWFRHMTEPQQRLDDEKTYSLLTHRFNFKHQRDAEVFLEMVYPKTVNYEFPHPVVNEQLLSMIHSSPRRNDEEYKQWRNRHNDWFANNVHPDDFVNIQYKTWFRDQDTAMLYKLACG